MTIQKLGGTQKGSLLVGLSWRLYAYREAASHAEKEADLKLRPTVSLIKDTAARGSCRLHNVPAVISFAAAHCQHLSHPIAIMSGSACQL